MRALAAIGKKHCSGEFNEADIADAVMQLALANPATVAAMIAAGRRYSAAEGVRFEDHIADKIRSHHIYQ